MKLDRRAFFGAVAAIVVGPRVAAVDHFHWQPGVVERGPWVAFDPAAGPDMSAWCLFTRDEVAVMGGYSIAPWDPVTQPIEPGAIMDVRYERR